MWTMCDMIQSKQKDRHFPMSTLKTRLKRSARKLNNFHCSISFSFVSIYLCEHRVFQQSGPNNTGLGPCFVFRKQYTYSRYKYLSNMILGQDLPKSSDLEVHLGFGDLQIAPPPLPLIRLQISQIRFLSTINECVQAISLDKQVL